MKKLILLLLFFAAKNFISQNGWATYTGNITGGSNPTSESTIFIDNAGNKWVGFSSASPTSGAAFGVYTNSTSTWTYWNKTTFTVLPSNRVNCFSQDNLGNIWIGTPSGLVKYDGANFTVYTTANGLPNNLINSLDFIGTMLYIGTQGGLSRYDGSTFTNYTVANTLLPINVVNAIKAENQNNIWLACGSSLVHFYINSSFTSTSYTTSVPSVTTTMNKIYIDGAGDKWINTNSGIFKFDNINFTDFSTMYPNFTGASINVNSSLVKGPNNGVLATATFAMPVAGVCLVELLSAGNYSLYFAPSPIKLSSYIANNAAGIPNITGSITVASSTYIASVYSFSYSNYSPVKAFGLGSGIDQNNYKYLDVNRVKAGIMNRGDMWWDIGNTGNASYEVPKNAVPSGGVHGGFAAGIWLGGLDASNQIHVAGQTYRQSGNDFWPGPLDTTNATIDTATAYNYDKIWKIDYNDINTFITQFNLGNVPTSYTPTPDMVNWPAKGTGNNTRNMAPFVDVNGDGLYDWKQGDYPKIKGDQALYFIFNDNFATHTSTGGLPFGVEVHAMAYAYGCPMMLASRNELAYTTFYDYKIYNRTNNNYNNVYVGFWTDVDIGNWVNDYIGSSVNENLGFAFNSSATDPNGGGANGYLNYPPAAGTTVLKGPLAPVADGKDNDNDNVIDEAGEECLMNIFDYYNNNIGSFPVSTINPVTKYHYYNILQGKWRDSTDITCGGTGYGGSVPTKIVYPWTSYIGNPCAGAWTEFTAGNLAGDRRYVASSGPFSLGPKSEIEVEYAYVWAVDSSASSNVHIASINKLVTDVQKVRTFYSSTIGNCLLSINVGLNENTLEGQFSIYPNPANSVLNIRSDNGLGKSVVSITDILGKKIMEIKNDNLYNASMNIESLSSGVYFLDIKSEKGQSVKKFVKQ